MHLLSVSRRCIEKRWTARADPVPKFEKPTSQILDYHLTSISPKLSILFLSSSTAFLQLKMKLKTLLLLIPLASATSNFINLSRNINTNISPNPNHPLGLSKLQKHDKFDNCKRDCEIRFTSSGGSPPGKPGKGGVGSQDQQKLSEGVRWLEALEEYCSVGKIVLVSGATERLKERWIG